VSYYQGDYYQGDGIGKRFGRWFRKKAAPALRKAAPLLGFVPGVGVVGAGAINAVARAKQPNRTTADTLVRVLYGPSAVPEPKPLRAKGAPKRVAVTARPRAAAAPRRAISPLQRSRGVTTARPRVMSPYRRNQLARARAAAARGRR